MPAWLFLLAGVVIGVAIALIARRRPPPQRAARPPAPAPAPAPAALPPPRSVHELARELESALGETAHPSELLTHPTFGEAVDAATALPYEQLLTLATSGHERLAPICAIALARRDDGAPAFAQILDQVQFSGAWTNYYLLEYLRCHAQGPVVGDVIVRARKWWADNAHMPGVLADFIDARAQAGESIDLGAALDAFGRAEIASIEALLGRLMTTHAGILRAQFAHWQSTRIDRRFLAEVGKILDPQAGGPILEIETRERAAHARALAQRARRRLRDRLERRGDAGGKVVVHEALSPAAAFALGEAFLERIVRPAGIDAPGEIVPEALELARHYLGTRALPGSLLDLLRLAHARAAKSEVKALGRETLVATLTELTGLPASVLDDRAELDPQGLRAHFARHVMGQPEAVDCLVDRVAMLKAGLTDPHRPVGVFLFAGPTGTGKTEVARTLAAFLFGAADRMIRLDMSEFQDAPSLGRIIGEADAQVDSNSLVAQIRRQPFSVVLLDEFEKAHPRVWDLFLQVFDAGRLTDAQGAVADFRHSIIILTTNLGATVHQGSSLGFTDGASLFSAAQVTRAIAQTFRPEFVNRLDRAVVFRPLARGVMREILKKELAAVLKRRGFARREWAVEWEDSAIEFLLERGFTADMGARPLRRAIEEHVLAPIAMTIVERRHPEGDQFLFVKSDGARIQVQFVDPDAPETTDEPDAAEAQREAPLPLDARLQTLDARLASEPWLAAKSALYARMNADGFWEQPERYDVLDRIERIDRLEAAAATARSLAARLANRRSANTRPLAEQLHLLEAALDDLDTERAGDVYLALETVAEDARATEREAWLARLAQMYTRWATRRRMRCTTLGVGPTSVVLAIGGLGAHSILAREAGLHVFELAGDGAGRATVRVRVAPQPVTPRPRAEGELDRASRCLAADAGVPSIVRRYREQPAPLVRDAVAGWRTGRLQHVLDGEFDLIV